jgi:hypothetical protein
VENSKETVNDKNLLSGGQIIRNGRLCVNKNTSQNMAVVASGDFSFLGLGCPVKYFKRERVYSGRPIMQTGTFAQI